MEEDPEDDGISVLARLSSSTKRSRIVSFTKTFFVWGTGNEILVRNERVVLGRDGNDDVDDTMTHKDEENDFDYDDSEDIKTKSTSWSHLSSKNKQEIAQFEPLVKDLVQKIRLASASASVGGAGDGATMENGGGSDFGLEAAREFSGKAI